MAEQIRLDVFLTEEGGEDRRIKLDKDVRVKGPYELPKGWKWVRLRDVAKTMTGGTPLRSREEYFDGSIPWVKSGELEDGYITETEEFLTESGLNNSSAKIFPAGTLLVAMYGATVGKVGILKINAATNQAVCAVFPDKRILDKMFLFYYFQKIRPKLIQRSFGGAQPNISQQFIRRLKIPLLPIEEQRRIVARIEELVSRAEEARKLKRIAAEEAEKIMQAALHKVFSRAEEKGWMWVRLGDICEVRRGASPRPKGDPKYFGGEIPWIKISDVTKASGKFLERTEEGLTQEGKKKSVYLERGTLIVTNSATIGLPKILKISGCVHDGFLAFLNISDNAKRDYIYWLFHFIKEHLEQIAPRGTQRNLNTTIAKNLRIPLPSLEEQNKIVTYLDKIGETVESLRSLQRKTVEELEKLVPAILDRAYKGEL